MAATDDHIALSKRQFPSRRTAVQALLQIYQDKVPVLEAETDSEWLYRIGWPGIDHYPDPWLAQNLRIVLGQSTADLPGYHVLEVLQPGGVVFLRSAHHSWALLAWATWLQRQSPQVRPTLVHLDFHADLERPSLLRTEQSGRFASPVGGEPLDMRRPETIPAYIRRGLVGIGSFIVPFLHTLNGCDMLHIYPPTHPAMHRQGLELERTFVPSPAVGDLGYQPGVAYNRLSEQAPPCQYVATDDLELLTNWVPSGPVLLDIDLDYFCNRFDTHSSVNQPLSSPADVSDSIGRLLGCLKRSSLLPAIAVVTIALSPGFYPSEFWSATVPRLEQPLRCWLNGQR